MQIFDMVSNAFKHDIRASINFIDVLTQSKERLNKTQISALLEKMSVKLTERNYFSIFRMLFDKTQRDRKYSSRL